ncbi:MAG: SWIM zinc finger family protein [Planctomycetaceae bacterium]
MSAILDYTYRYPFASRLEREGTAWGLRLATFGGSSLGGPAGASLSVDALRPVALPRPFFFEGRCRSPRVVADLLLALANTVNSRFYLPGASRMLDPVVTSSEELLRLEGFSSCCGVYARVDLSADAFDCEIQGRGTTNVDFNASMCAALTQVRNGDDVRLSVGVDQFRLTQATGEVVEKKVALPIRWIKGFTNVQAYLPALELRFEVDSIEARRFIRSLPRGVAPKSPSFVQPLGAGLRLSQREAKGSVRVIGTDRLKLLEPLLHQARQLCIWSDDASGTSAWDVVFEHGRFLLFLSPEIWRGFSGEGQQLERLAGKSWETALPYVRDALHDKSRIDASRLASQLELKLSEVEAALAVLGSRGLVGYDIVSGCYFHRELPFDMEKIETLQPRLIAARKLIEAKKARVVQRMGTDDMLTAEVMVQGTDVEHRVRLMPDGDKCTCPWYSKHQNERGPCKHILAAHLLIEGES